MAPVAVCDRPWPPVAVRDTSKRHAAPRPTLQTTMSLYIHTICESLPSNSRERWHSLDRTVGTTATPVAMCRVGSPRLATPIHRRWLRPPIPVKAIASSARSRESRGLRPKTNREGAFARHEEQGTGNREQGTGNGEQRVEEASLWRGSLGQLVSWGQGAGSAGGYARPPKHCAARSPLTILVSLPPVDQFSLRGAWHPAVWHPA